MKPSKNFLVITGTALLISGALVAQGHSQVLPSASPSATPTATATPLATASPGAALTLDDTEAMNYLHHVNNLEIQEATNAQGVAQSQSAQTLAQTLLTDHRQNEQQVQQLAAQKGIQLFAFQPATYEAAADAVLASLAGTSAYDTEFLRHERESHQDVLTKLQALQGEVSDPDVRNLITQTIPVVQKHIQLASASAGAAPSPSPTPSATPSSQPGTSGGTAGTTPGGSSTSTTPGAGGYQYPY